MSTATVTIRPFIADAAAHAERPASRLRLTRRGRAVLTTLAATPLVIAAAIFGLQSGGAVATDSAATVTFETVTVAPGESLWSIAERLAPNADPRDVLLEIVALNGLPSSQVQPGQQLALPLAYTS